LTNLIQSGDIVLLISEDNKRFYTKVRPDHLQHTHQGIIAHNDLLGQPAGRKVTTNTGHRYTVVEPSLPELMKGVSRNTQIVYPKDAGRIIFNLNIYAGRRVIEAGSGSGSLTMALARFVAPTGRVYSYEIRPEIQQNARANIDRAGLSDYVDFKLRDIEAGFAETEVDALFLDVREPWRYLPQAKAALKAGGFFGAILPTTNQVSELLVGLKQHDFGGVEVEELLVRRYKPIPGRLRPEDSMVAHTGYLIFARNINLDIAPTARQRKIDWLAGANNEESDTEA
jgi:tRNA (adenine57-N1/adenine58-N1)-methyltransferase